MNQPVKIVRNILVAFLPMLVVFLWDAIINDKLGLYGVWPNLDIPMHITGGFVTAWSWYRLYETYRRELKLTIRPRWLFGLLLIGLTAFVAVFWELYEFILERMTAAVIQGSIADTVGDQVNGVIGATVFSLCLLWFKRPRAKK